MKYTSCLTPTLDTANDTQAYPSDNLSIRVKTVCLDILIRFRK